MDLWFKAKQTKIKFKKIKLWKLKDQYFREYYRSGNIFYYRIDGKFNAEDFKLLSGLSENGIVNNQVPLRYILINPYDIVANNLWHLAYCV